MPPYLLYALFGLLFGVLDWYYLNALAFFDWGDLGDNPLVVPVIVALNLGIWLVPIIPTALVETRRTRSLRRAALVGALVWCCAVLGYYAWYAALLLFSGLPHMDHLLYSNRFDPAYGSYWRDALSTILLNQVLEWLPVALLVGAVSGWITGWLYLRRRRTPGT